MNNKERLNALIGFMPGENAADAALIDGDIDPGAAYVKEAYPSIRLAAITLIETLLSTPDNGNTMSGFWTKYDRSAVEKRLASLKAEITPASKSAIRALSW